jgi:hypothetical protein
VVECEETEALAHLHDQHVKGTFLEIEWAA